MVLQHTSPRYTSMLPTCPAQYDFLSLLRKRHADWSGQLYLRSHNLWQAAVNEKRLGYAFAESVGVRSPRLLCCSCELAALPGKWPAHWGRDFVVKPPNGHSGRGVLLLSNGVDIFSGQRFDGAAAVRALYARQGLGNTVVVEQLVKPDPGRNHTTATDYKFLMFGDKVGAVFVVQNRHSKRACSLYVDDKWRRVDSHGCAWFERQVPPHAHPHGGYKPCADDTPSPRGWARLVGAARRLGGALGVHMRIDLFLDELGVPRLGEFTPWHGHGSNHCGSRRRSDGSVDACYLGRMWREGGVEGGPIRPPPRAFARWEALQRNGSAQCMLAMQQQQRAASGHGHGPLAQELRRFW